MTDITDAIQGRGVLVSLNISTWSARRLDKAASADIASVNGTDAGRVRAHKTLIDPAKLKPIDAIVRDARDYHERVTVPWTYAGVAMLPAAKIMDYDVTIAQFKAKFDTAVDVLVREYPVLVAQQARALGRMFNLADYPPAPQIRSKFGMHVTMSMLPATQCTDFRVDIPDSVRQRIEADIHEQYQKLTGTLRARLEDDLIYTFSRLRDYDAAVGTDTIVRLSAPVVDRIVDTRDLLGSANLTQDPDLSACALALEHLTFDLGRMKTDGQYRGYLAHALRSCLNALGVDPVRYAVGSV